MPHGRGGIAALARKGKDICSIFQRSNVGSLRNAANGSQSIFDAFVAITAHIVGFFEVVYAIAVVIKAVAFFFLRLRTSAGSRIKLSVLALHDAVFAKTFEFLASLGVLDHTSLHQGIFLAFDVVDESIAVVIFAVASFGVGFATRTVPPLTLLTGFNTLVFAGLVVTGAGQGFIRAFLVVSLAIAVVVELVALFSVGCGGETLSPLATATALLLLASLDTSTSVVCLTVAAFTGGTVTTFVGFTVAVVVALGSTVFRDRKNLTFTLAPGAIIATSFGSSLTGTNIFGTLCTGVALTSVALGAGGATVVVDVAITVVVFAVTGFVGGLHLIFASAPLSFIGTSALSGLALTYTLGPTGTVVTFFFVTRCTFGLDCIGCTTVSLHDTATDAAFACQVQRLAFQIVNTCFEAKFVGAGVTLFAVLPA